MEHKSNSPTKIEMTAKQLASLDLLIKAKERGGRVSEDAADFLGAVAAASAVAAGATIAVTATPVAGTACAVAVAADICAIVAQAFGGHAAFKDKAFSDQLNQIAKNMPLKELIEIRNSAITKG